MLTAQDAVALQEQIRRTGRSLLQYTTESFPWSRKPADKEMLSRILEMAKSEQDMIPVLTRFLKTYHIAQPNMGAYPMHFTTMNFLAVPRLVLLILEHHEGDVNHLESVLANIQDPVAKELLERLLALKRSHMKQLQELLRVPETAA